MAGTDDAGEVQLRVATPDDTPFLRRMQWVAILASPRLIAARGIETLRQLEDQYWAEWPRPGETAFVAEDGGGRPLGAVILHVHERDGERVVGYRLGIAVEESARGRGVGRPCWTRPSATAGRWGRPTCSCASIRPTSRPCEPTARPGSSSATPTAGCR